ncbi:hypothetical protein A5631_18345 [Mycolicibacter heraklionensis]|nr:hypothetical protein A5671_15700 [Mycolicibacter heraklionensis]OBJ29135.1 hypothetical protein A5631_18345 [Mycolicibacter heraklionensis]
MKLLTDSMLRASGRTRSADEDRNLDTVLSSYHALTVGDETQIDRWYSQDYLEHAPTVPGTTLGELKQYVATFGQTYPRGEIRLDRLLADGDYVYVASVGRFEPEDQWTSLMEVFRLEAGLIVEHWETLTPPPDPTGRYRNGQSRANVKVVAGDGVELAVQISGPAVGPPVVFLHGVTSSRATYDWLPDEVITGRRIIRPDHRGHGESGHRTGSYSLSRYVNDTITILETVAGGPAVLVGFSLGGAIAWTIAQRRPDLVTAAFLEDPALFPEFVYSTDTITSLLRWTITQRQAWQDRRADLDEITGELEAKAVGPYGTLGDLTHPDSLRTVAQSLMALDPGVTESAIDATMTDGIDTTSPVHVPTFILAADEAVGGAFAQRYDRQMIERHPSVEIHRVPASPHTIHTSLAGRETYLRLLAAFLDHHAPPQSIEGLHDGVRP